MSSDNMSAILAGDEAAIQDVPERIVAAWAVNDADAFAAMFAEDGSLILPGDVYLRGREEVRSFMAKAFAGPYRGTRVSGKPLALKPLGPDTALLITQGGILAPGETEVSAERAIRASWVLIRRGQEWLITAYQNTPVGTG